MKMFKTKEEAMNWTKPLYKDGWYTIHITPDNSVCGYKYRVWGGSSFLYY